jgi:hypothetical protein
MLIYLLLLMSGLYRSQPKNAIFSYLFRKKIQGFFNFYTIFENRKHEYSCRPKMILSSGIAFIQAIPFTFYYPALYNLTGQVTNVNPGNTNPRESSSETRRSNRRVTRSIKFFSRINAGNSRVVFL